MSKTKELEKILEIETDERELGQELITGEKTEDELEEETVLDDEEVDPFKDKWEE